MACFKGMRVRILARNGKLWESVKFNHETKYRASISFFSFFHL